MTDRIILDRSPMLPAAEHVHIAPVRSSTMLLLEEELSRARCRDYERAAAESRLARQARAVRREQRRSDRSQPVPLRRRLRARLALTALR